ncbi:hypothetical protein AYL99_06762 [Fonsecaea erecta]|uniref:Uncharacterized protein n=1 Tax=Fonsecaea erecta TaxID=1367422 RepID=A0A178ZI26_9EURO|nr:hypothetical protein AYL99_06762 [Fonsecaea erecta]OAP59464.1 hypothetical protein AYL99_06762 [Fonsecaea erecta]
MVTTRSQERKIGSLNSPPPAVETGTAFSPEAGITPTRKSKTASASTPSSGEGLASIANKKIEVVIEVAPSLLGQEHAQLGGNGEGAEISRPQPGNLARPHVSGFQEVPEALSPNGEAEGGQHGDGGALEGIPQDSREIQATLANRSKSLVSPSHTPAAVPTRKRFTSEDPEDTISGAVTFGNQFAGAITPNKGEKDDVDDDGDEDDDDAPPEVVSSSVAAQQAMQIPNPSLQHSSRKKRKMLSDVGHELGSPVQVPGLAIASEPQRLNTAQDKAEELTTSSQIIQLASSESETGQPPKSIADNHSAANDTADESIEIVMAPTSNESPAPANTTTQSARTQTGLQNPENFNTTSQRQPSEPLAEEDIPTPNEVTRRVHSGEQDQIAVNLSSSLTQDSYTSMADCGPSATNPEVRNPPLQGTAETEATAESSSTMTPAPEGLEHVTRELQANTTGTSETTVSAELSTSVAVKRSNSRTPTLRARPKSKPFPHRQQVLPRPKPTSLQQYRTRLLGRHPRKTEWGVPGFRKAKFVGV